MLIYIFVIVKMNCACIVIWIYLDDLLIYYSDKYIYVNTTHTNKYVLIIHYTQSNKAYQSLVANTYKSIVLQISKHPIFITELIIRI